MVISDENELAGALYEGAPTWIPYYSGNLACDCETIADPDEQRRARAVRAWTWGKYLSGEARLARRRDADGQMIYLIRRIG
jgi:hypothetical protein